MRASCGGVNEICKYVQILCNTTTYECLIHWTFLHLCCSHRSRAFRSCQLQLMCELTYRPIWNLHTASGAEQKNSTEDAEKEVSLLCVYPLTLCSIRERKQRLSRILAVRITVAQTAPLRRIKDPPDKTSCHVNPRWNKYSNVVPDSNKNSRVCRDKKGRVIKKQLARFPYIWEMAKKWFDWHLAILFHRDGMCHIIIERD